MHWVALPLEAPRLCAQLSSFSASALSCSPHAGHPSGHFASRALEMPTSEHLSAVYILPPQALSASRKEDWALAPGGAMAFGERAPTLSHRQVPHQEWRLPTAVSGTSAAAAAAATAAAHPRAPSPPPLAPVMPPAHNGDGGGWVDSDPLMRLLMMEVRVRFRNHPFLAPSLMPLYFPFTRSSHPVRSCRRLARASPGRERLRNGCGGHDSRFGRRWDLI